MSNMFDECVNGIKNAYNNRVNGLINELRKESYKKVKDLNSELNNFFNCSICLEPYTFSNPPKELSCRCKPRFIICSVCEVRLTDNPKYRCPHCYIKTPKITLCSEFKDKKKKLIKELEKLFIDNKLQDKLFIPGRVLKTAKEIKCIKKKYPKNERQQPIKVKKPYKHSRDFYCCKHCKYKVKTKKTILGHFFTKHIKVEFK
jgi:hypothetical protein